MSIFVQIASYRDPELIKTLDSLFDNACNPQNLNICIAWQKDSHESLGKYENYGNILPIPIPYQNSKGACWARNLIQQHYHNEDFTLQIDSHMRFIPGWDKELIDQLSKLKILSNKPVLTTYLPSYNPETDERVQIPWKMVFDRFIPEGTVFTRPEGINNFVELSSPIKTQFYSAHFCFTAGQMSVEVPHDPELYFHGEEMSIAARLFTHGYDLYHPHNLIAWHEYTRRGRNKHWDDHTGEQKTKPWWDINQESHSRVRQLFFQDPRDQEFGIYDFGKERSLDEYSNFSGLNFKQKIAHPNTVRGIEPPILLQSITPDEWIKACDIQYYGVIGIPQYLFCDMDYDFWGFFVHNENKQELARKDVFGDELDSILKSKYPLYELPFHTKDTPSTYTLWPHSKTKGWLEQITGKIQIKHRL